MAALLALAALGTAMDVAGKIGEASAGRRVADNRAEALKKAAQRRLEQGKIISANKLVEGGMNQTSQLSSMLSRGVDRASLVSDLSLDEIAKRAQFESGQAMQEAQDEYNTMMSEANSTIQNSRDAQKAALWGAGGSLLSLGSKYYTGRYGADAGKMATLWGA
jgi:hypothetical protein